MLKRLFNILIALIITLFFLLPYIILRQVETEREMQRNKYIAFQKVNDISHYLIEELNKSFEYTEVLDIIVRNNPNCTEIIDSYSEMILKKHDIIANVAVAPDGIIQYIYPTVPNKDAIGHDLMHDQNRYPFIKKAIEEKTATMQGPVEAIQGGTLIFNRKAIFMKKNNKDSFWGLCVVSIDFEKLVTSIGINVDNKDYYLSLKVPKSDGYHDFIWGDTECFKKESISKTISIGDQEWEFLIYPKHGWMNSSNNWLGLKASDSLYVLLSAILFTFVLIHLNRYSRHSLQSKTDLMTGALNKDAFTKKVLKKLRDKAKSQGIIVIDINQFKSINDTYGHLTGDLVITEVSKRLMKVLSNKDLLSRWGGDEFVIYLNNLSDNTDIDNLIIRLHHEMEEPIDANGTMINVGIALGYSIFPDDGGTYEELYEKADNRMYLNKQMDSNSV